MNGLGRSQGRVGKREGVDQKDQDKEYKTREEVAMACEGYL